VSKRGAKVKEEVKEEEADEDAVMSDGDVANEDVKGEEAEDDVKVSNSNDQDELAEINGVKPNVYLKDTEETEVAGSGYRRLLCNSLSAHRLIAYTCRKSKYKLKRTWDHYSWYGRAVLYEARADLYSVLAR
jgi:DNA ligase-1